MNDTWMSPKQVGALANRHPKTVLKALRRNELHGYQPGGANHSWRVHPDDATAWIRGESKKPKFNR